MRLLSGAAQAAVALGWRIAIVAAALVTLFFAWTVSPMPSPPLAMVSATARSPSASDSATAAAPAGPHSHDAIATHPLFYPSRLPWVPPPPPEPEPVAVAPSPLTNYALVGVIVSGQTRSALIRPPGATNVITLHEGQALEGWTLQQISRTQLRFAAGDAGYEMTFLKPSESGR